MEDNAAVYKFLGHAEFEEHLADVIGRADSTLQLFDPDFAVFPLGSMEMDAALRQFLAGGGSIQMAMHRSTHIERHYPRFMSILRDFGHKVECKLTSRSLHHLTDSFCIADGIHIVRRFHSDHMRGEAAFDSPASTELSKERFDAIWLETISALHATTTGL